MAQVVIKFHTVRPSLQDKFFFEPFVDWENRPWIEHLEAGIAAQPGLIKAYIEEHLPREELVARREELREDLKFMADDCMDFEPEYFVFPQQSGWPTWSADMSPPFNPFTLTHTMVCEFDTLENAESWYQYLMYEDPGVTAINQMISDYNNQFWETWYIDGVETPHPSKLDV